jgi:hypothetical protein
VSGAGFDWQFMIVTLAALGGCWILLRPLWVSLSVGKAAGKIAGKTMGACSRCPSAACKQEPVPEASSGLVRIGSGRRANR